MDDEGTSLSDLLNDAELPGVETPQEPEEPEVPRDEHGRFAAKGVEPEEAPQEPVPPTDKLPKDDYKAIREEREKRQNLERELEALKQQIQAAQNPPAPPPSIWEDDAAALRHVQEEATSAAVQQATLNARLDMSEMLVRQANPDFEEVKPEILGLLQNNPVLYNQVMADPHPWNKAYQIAKNHRTMQELGATDLDTLKAKIREELAAEMQASAPVAQGLPPTLTTARNVGARSGPAWSGPASLKDLLA